MPSSKRNRTVPTSQTRKDRKSLVKRLHTNIQECAASYPYAFVFSVDNMRNTFLKRVRTDLGTDSRLFMGKTKVMAVALGRTPETEVVGGIGGLVPYLKGEVGLLFTRMEPKEVEGLFGEWVEVDYARSGAVAERGFTIPKGQLYTAYGAEGGEEDPLPVAIEPQLRKLGVPTRIVKGKVTLEESAEAGADGMDEDGEEQGYVVCKEGDVLDSRQTSILKIFGVRMAEFKMDLKAVFDKEAGKVREIGGMDVEEE